MLLNRIPDDYQTAAMSVLPDGRTSTPIPLRQFEHLDVCYDDTARTCWAHLLTGQSNARATRRLMSDLLDMHANLRTVAAAKIVAGQDSMQYFVLGSSVPGIFNLGGDIVLFADRIRAGDRAAMHAYAHQCIDVVHGTYSALDLPIITIALVQGDALGGGFETALSHDVLVAERSARLGLPEILFNLFPGMGAYSFLSRRIGGPAAEKMILSGNLYTGAQLYGMGIVDVLAEDGEGEAVVREYIERNSRKFNAQHAMCRTRRQVNPVTNEELRGVVDIWVETAMSVTEPDLRKMERLAQAQQRRLLRPAASMQQQHAAE
jgi:DSF synthase